MALSCDSVKRGCVILNHINPRAFNSPQPPDPSDLSLLDTIIGEDLKSDGGYESLYVDIQDMTEEQQLYWKVGSKMIPNSCFCKELTNRITRIGWF